MKTGHQILNMDTRTLQRLVCRLQVEIAEHNLSWAGGYDLDAQDEDTTALARAKQSKREVYAATKKVS